MGRQSSRIYFNGKDHKEMVIWDGERYIYHDAAYIWNGESFDLVWQKLKLKLLYETEYPIQPVSSENNKYLYFIENNEGSIVYRLVIDDNEPEKEEWYTSDRYTIFTAPTSSRGIGIHATQSQYGYSFDYKILNFETGGHGEIDTYDFYEDTGVIPVSIGPPILSDQTASKAIEHNHKYASIMGTYLQGQGFQLFNFLFNISINGISAKLLDNRDGDGTYIDGKMFNIGRMNESESDPRSLLPRFIRLDTSSNQDNVIVFEFGAGTQHGKYSPIFGDFLPFTILRATGGGVAEGAVKVTRDNKLPVLGSDYHIWIIQINDDDIEFTDTEIESPTQYVGFDMHPSFNYAMTMEDLEYHQTLKTIKIVNINTKKVELNLNEEIRDMQIKGAYFVGHKCLCVTGDVSGVTKNRLYKWR